MFKDAEAKYMPCKGCGEKMWGIMDYEARTICEDCGGNTTEFNRHNQNPMKKAA